MIYSKKEFGQSLKKQLSDYDVVRLARWTHSLFLEHSSHLEHGLQEILMQLAAMEEGAEFEFSKAELRKLADDLISDGKEPAMSVSVDPDIAIFIHKLAEKENIGVERIVNDWLRKNMKLMQSAM